MGKERNTKVLEPEDLTVVEYGWATAAAYPEEAKYGALDVWFTSIRAGFWVKHSSVNYFVIEETTPGKPDNKEVFLNLKAVNSYLKSVYNAAKKRA